MRAGCRSATSLSRQVAQLRYKARDHHAVPKRETDILIEARIRAHIEQAIKELQITKEKAAKMIGIDKGSLTRILNGERGMKVGTIYRISKGLGINAARMFNVDPPDEFWHGDDPRKK